MRPRLGWLCLLAGLPVAAETDLSRLLKGVEARYNRSTTIQVLFEQSLTGTGRIARKESGVVYLRKPGRMRWEYHEPPGKLFVSDGKDVYFYSPATNRVEKSKLKESDDLRAPLAFLMGRLDFFRDFREFRHRPEGRDTLIVATPKSEKAPYTEVEFVVTPEHQIRELKVTGQDQSVMQFRLSQERLNPPLAAKLFEFRTPPGADLVEIPETEGER